MARAHDGKLFRMLAVIDEHTREWSRSWLRVVFDLVDVLKQPAWLFVTRGVPEHICFDNGSEFTADASQDWLSKFGVQAQYIAPGKSWENGYSERINGALDGGLLIREIFYPLK